MESLQIAAPTHWVPLSGDVYGSQESHGRNLCLRQIRHLTDPATGGILLEDGKIKVKATKTIILEKSGAEKLSVLLKDYLEKWDERFEERKLWVAKNIKNK